MKLARAILLGLAIFAARGCIINVPEPPDVYIEGVVVEQGNTSGQEGAYPAE